MFQVECEGGRSRETGEQVQERGGAEPHSLLAEPFVCRVRGRCQEGQGAGSVNPRRAAEVTVRRTLCAVFDRGLCPEARWDLLLFYEWTAR